MTDKEKATGGGQVASKNTQKKRYTGNSAFSQRLRLLAALRKKPMTTLEIRSELDIMHPAQRVIELKDKGVRIISQWAYDASETGNLHRVARYHLISEAGARL